jgi:hypothetical protein
MDAGGAAVPGAFQACAPHGGSDQDLRASAERVERGHALLEPTPDRALVEIPAGFAVARIIEADAGAAVLGRPARQRLGLCAAHVRLEAAEPEKPWRCTGLGPDGDPSHGSRAAEFEVFGRKIVGIRRHRRLRMLIPARKKPERAERVYRSSTVLAMQAAEAHLVRAALPNLRACSARLREPGTTLTSAPFLPIFVRAATGHSMATAASIAPGGALQQPRRFAPFVAR